MIDNTNSQARDTHPLTQQAAAPDTPLEFSPAVEAALKRAEGPLTNPQRKLLSVLAEDAQICALGLVRMGEVFEKAVADQPDNMDDQEAPPVVVRDPLPPSSPQPTLPALPTPAIHSEHESPSPTDSGELGEEGKAAVANGPPPRGVTTSSEAEVVRGQEFPSPPP